MLTDEYDFADGTSPGRRKPLSATNPGLRKRMKSARDLTADNDQSTSVDGKVLAFDPMTGMGLVGVNDHTLNVDLSRTKLISKGYVVLHAGQDVRVQPPEDQGKYVVSIEAL